MATDRIKPEVRAFFGRALQCSQLEDGDNIFEVGGASSLFAMQLVLFIEQQFGIELDDSDLERDNLSSIDAIAALVTRKWTDSE
jgi:acyl carrier protein